MFTMENTISLVNIYFTTFGFNINIYYVATQNNFLNMNKSIGISTNKAVSKDAKYRNKQCVSGRMFPHK